MFYKWLYKFFNNDKIAELNKTIKIYKERNKQLEDEVGKYKSYKLKFDVIKLYVEDDEALLELFELAEKKEYGGGQTQHQYDLGRGSELSNIQASYGTAFATLREGHDLARQESKRLRAIGLAMGSIC